MATPLRAILSGSLFGAAITAAGVYSPAVIIGQLKLEDFHMLKSFIAASASSAIIITLFNALSLSAAKPRLANTLSLFSTYDGNILGGALLGAGLALTGACPGTVFPQLVAGIPSAPNVLLGALIGGILFSRFGKPLLGKVENKKAIEQPTIYEQLGTSRIVGLVGFEVICLSIIGAVSLLGEEKHVLLVPATIGGVLIGGSQLTSLLLTGNTLGISTAYEQVGDLFWWSVTSSAAPSSSYQNDKTPSPSIKSTTFALGTLLGSWITYQSLLSSRVALAGADEPQLVIGTARAVIGGIALIFGSRLAGGCTSGHGISGMSLGSVSSIISVASMFVCGISVAMVLG